MIWTNVHQFSYRSCDLRMVCHEYRTGANRWLLQWCCTSKLWLPRGSKLMGASCRSTGVATQPQPKLTDLMPLAFSLQDINSPVSNQVHMFAPAFSNTNSVFPNQQYRHQTFYTCWHLATWHQAAPVMGGFHLQHDVNHSNHTSDTL